MIRCGTATDPLLRRPISFNRIDKKKGTFDILFRVLGKGTQYIASLEAGAEIDVIGPLGNGFDIFSLKKNVVLIGGGAGIAPLLALAESIRSKSENITAVIGANDKNGVLIKKELTSIGCKVFVSTDDGSMGMKGKATDALKKLVKDGQSLYTTQIFACGPRPMIKALQSLVKDLKVPAQASLEEWMACGVGACFGCTIKTTKGNKKVCSDGPVFNIEELKW